MQCGEHEVPRQRGPDGEFCRFAVADFSHHDDVGVLAQERSQCRGESEVDFWVHRSLRDALQFVFDGLFDSRDVQFWAANHLEQRVERGCLARARGARDKKHPVGLVDFFIDCRDVSLRHAQGIKFVDNLSLVEQAKNHLLPVICGECRHADVHRLAPVVETDAAVLRTALFCDVHARHDLEA